jgi:hypothetical protein
LGLGGHTSNEVFVLRTRLLSVAAAAVGLAALAGALVALPPPAAHADPTDGTLTVIVNRDVDKDGAFSAADVPQPGIVIVVSDADGEPVTGRTDDDGRFVLTPTDKLTGGRYFVVAEIPADLGDLVPVPASETYSALSTTVDVSADNQTVRMGVASEPKPDPTPEPDPTTEQPSGDSKLVRFAVGDRVWRDSDRSGTQAPSEPGQGKITVQLLNSDGEVVDSKMSSSSGRFVFDDLAAGTYSLRFAGVPPGSRLTPAGLQDDVENDSDPDFAGQTPPFTLGVGEPNVREAKPADRVHAAYINSTIDAGVTPLCYAIGDHVWYDLDRDGTRQAGEPAAAATVSLLSGEKVVASTTTDAQGHYLFNHLEAGSYQVAFSNLPPHRAFTARGVGVDPAADSDADPKTGLSPVITLGPNSADLVPASDVGISRADFANLTVNAGLVGSYTVGDTVWQDHNGNGVLDTGDGGVAGMKVELRDSDQQVLASTTTSDTGRFAFDGLAAGSYQLKFGTPPVGLRFTSQRSGANPAVDSDADPVGLTPVIVLGDNNPADTTIDAGLTTPENFSAAPVPGAASAAPVDTELSSTGGVPAPLPVLGLVAILSGAACLVAGQQGRLR